ncbi:hypothetical protein QJU89_05875 [Pasteurella skyensis]|uniref:Uncharacterized protein n=1 Tax=Phocoenobacter skyensis TaxID=97481 RepID=A0AAJ6P0F4_9PAST|nr:hypothetical protein [Pasteurella skyensis]MDP8162819.1 hypothetical protein [Pasteurella skyensis]MDP8172594.1 hypothetical protein [Pasteurella skyensis]MDP8179094.1 hypothetical protein [Pasteurella skyensis]MDP8183221.1 hypothetical protein [Pasteurella skyensis]MDP8189272.1 hypothetical protein [Pasteurella skyensis]
MTITVEFWHLVGMLFSFLATCFGFAKILLAQFHNSMQERYNAQQKVNTKVDAIEKQVNNLNATLPLNYVLRDDYIRGQAILEAKMDALHKTLTEIYKKEAIK